MVFYLYELVVFLGSTQPLVELCAYFDEDQISLSSFKTKVWENNKTEMCPYTV